MNAVQERTELLPVRIAERTFLLQLKLDSQYNEPLLERLLNMEHGAAASLPPIHSLPSYQSIPNQANESLIKA